MLVGDAFLEFPVRRRSDPSVEQKVRTMTRLPGTTIDLPTAPCGTSARHVLPWQFASRVARIAAWRGAVARRVQAV